MTEPAKRWEQGAELECLFAEIQAKEKVRKRPKRQIDSQALDELVPKDAPAPAEDAPPRVSRSGDPRELEDWFQKLPASAQDEIRQRWQQEQDDVAWAEQLRRMLWKDDLIGGAIVFGFVAAFSVLMYPSPGREFLVAVPIAAAFGGGGGFALGRMGAGRFTTVLLSSFLWIAWVLVTGMCFPVWHMWELMIISALTGGVGMMRESRRIEGYGK